MVAAIGTYGALRGVNVALALAYPSRPTIATVSACVTHPGAALSTTAKSGPDDRAVVAEDAVECGAAAAGAAEARVCDVGALGPAQATRPTTIPASDTRVFTGTSKPCYPSAVLMERSRGENRYGVLSVCGTMSQGEKRHGHCHWLWI